MTEADSGIRALTEDEQQPKQAHWTEMLASDTVKQPSGPYERSWPLDMGAARLPGEDDLAFDQHTLSPHAGATIKAPKLVMVGWGTAIPFWSDLGPFGSDLMTMGYLRGAEAQGTGNGQFLGQYQIQSSPPAVITDTMAQQAIAWAIGNLQGIPKADPSTIYALYLPSGVAVQAMNGQNCTQFCGYHGWLGYAAYAVIPATDCAGCHGPNTTLQALCMVTAHEVAEACTDTIPGQGWMEDSTGAENADICAWQPVQYGPWTVQPYWVNGVGCTFGNYQTAPPPPQPPPPTDDLTARIVKLEQGLASIQSDLDGIARKLASIKEAL